MTDQTRLDALLVHYEELRERQTPVSAEELCRDCPELLDEFRRQLRAVESMNALLGGASAATAEPPALGGVSESSEALSTGSRFRILRFHARGGLGEVHVAHDEALRRDVALKRLQAPHARNPHSRARFLREAEITSRLEHPNVVPIHAAGQDADGRPFYAMRFVQGETLHEALTRFHTADTPGRDPGERRLALRQLLTRFVAVCNTVAYAHNQGVLHRDLKPGNILLGSYGETLLLDWGLAKQESENREQRTESRGQEEGDGALRAAETQQGTVLGTPAYMSPEQAAGRWDEVGPASDIYSLGATLYVVLTGQSPFPGREAAEVVDKVKRGEFVAPRRVKPDVPAALEAVCRKAMAHRPEQRYPTALALAADLEHWLADEPVGVWREPWTVRVGRWIRRHRLLVTAAAATLVVAALSLAVAAVFLRAAQQREAAARAQAEKNLGRVRETVEKYYTKVSESPELKEHGLEPLRRDLLQLAKDFYEELVQEESSDPEVRAEQGLAYIRLARITTDIGSKHEAIQLYQKAIAIFADLTAAYPAIAAYARDLAQSEDLLGSQYKQIGQPTQAEEAQVRALRLRKELARAHPAEPDYQSHLAQSHNNLGSFYRDNGRLDQAQAEMDQALALAGELVRQHPSVRNYRAVLANVHNSRGVLYLAKRQPKQREEELRQALDLWDRLAREHPADTDYKYRLSFALNNLGDLMNNRGQRSAAEEFFKKALVLREELVRIHPTVSDYRQRLASICFNLGILYNREDRAVDSERMFRRALGIQEELVRAYPETPDYAVAVGKTCTGLGRLVAKTDPQAALPLFERAVRVNEAELDKQPRNQAIRKALVHDHGEWANALNKLAARTESLPQRREYRTEAVKHYDRALALDDGSLRDHLRIYHACTWAHVGGPHAQLTAEARALADKNDAPDGLLFNAACIYSLSSANVRHDATLTEAERKQLAEDYATRAMALLHRVRATGFLKVPANLDYLKSDSELDALRAREDFQKLLREVLAEVNGNQGV